MFIVTKAQEHGTQQWRLCQIKRSVRVRRDQSPRLGFALVLWDAGKVNFPEGTPRRIVNDLHGLVRNRVEPGSQALMSCCDHIQAILDGFGVYLAVDLESPGNIIDRVVRLELVEKPQSLLRK